MMEVEPTVNKTIRLLFMCTSLFFLLTTSIVYAETVIDITVGEEVRTIIEDDDSTSGYIYDSTICTTAGEAKRTIDLWTEGPLVDNFIVTDEWTGTYGYMEIDTHYSSDGFGVDHFICMSGHWYETFQTVTNALGVDDSDLWIDNRMSIIEGGIFVDTDYMNYGECGSYDAKADFDAEVYSDKIWFESHGTYTDDYGGLEYMSAHVWGEYDMKFGVEDLRGSNCMKFEDYEFEFTAEASSEMSEAYIRFYDFSVFPEDGSNRDFFSVWLDIFWTNCYGDPEAHIFASGDSALEGIIETSIGLPEPFIEIYGWLVGE